MLKNLKLRPILASVLFLALAREAVCDDSVTTYGLLFNDHVEITVPGYQGGTNKLYDFPLLVQLKEDSPAGFTYARVDPLGNDIRFVFVEGTTSNAVPYEVDTWNTNGVSSLWVHVPTLYKNPSGNSPKLVMYWAPDDPDELPANAPRTVWNGYTGVWHLNGTAAESTTNAIASTAGATAAAQEGKIGSALGTRNSGSFGPIFSVPADTPVDAMTEGAYTVSAWLRVNAIDGKPWLYSARTSQSGDEFGAELAADGSYVKVRLHADSEYNPEQKFAVGNWVHLAIVHNGSNDVHRLYLNGVGPYDSTVQVDKPGTAGLAFGGLVGASANGTLNGDLDDVRILPEAKTKVWFTNEYAQVVSSSYISFGGVESTGVSVYVDGGGGDEKTPTGDDPAPGAIGDVSPADYAGTWTFVPAEVAEGVVFTNFVTLIKVWENETLGFDPKALPFGTEDIRFFDSNGNVLPYDIDTWNVQGDSFFWVKVPKLTSSTTITMCWGLKEGKTLPENLPTDVWSDYAGVWHLSSVTNAADLSANASFGTNEMSMIGPVGMAAGTALSGQKGPILEVEADEEIEDLTNRTFTASGWVYLNRSTVKYGALFSRGTDEDPAWGAQFCGGTSGDSSKLAVEAGRSSLTAEVSIATETWTKFDIVYSSDRLALYLNGSLVKESPGAQSFLGGASDKFAIGGFVTAAGEALGTHTLNGYIDEFRLRVGEQSLAESAADTAQCRSESFYTRQSVVWDSSAILQNRWRQGKEPTASKTEWNEGDEPATFTLGEPWYGEPVLSYMNRSTGEVLPGMPTEYGDYCAVITVEESAPYSSLTYTIDFRIRMHRPTHDLGTENDRILLLNGDASVSDGQVLAQSYVDVAQKSDRPYWVHDVYSGDDYTSTSWYYNFCGGLRHTYYSRDGKRRLWDLIGVRYGNTYNNAEEVWEDWDGSDDWEDVWMQPDQNYLSWNPQGGRLADNTGLLAGEWPEYAAQAVMCNVMDASVNSCLYTNGIGTIYFDCVNSHAEDAANGSCRLVVEVATNAVSGGLPTDAAIVQTHREWSDEKGAYVTVVDDPYEYAGWQRVEMKVCTVNGSAVGEAVETNELTLALAGGGSNTNFYRVYVPVNFMVPARFRIRRTAINPEFTIATDVESLILVDNVICSVPTDRIRVEPRGFYDTTKVMRETVGYEGAFDPTYPSVNDETIYARAKASISSGQELTPGFLSSLRMHYRWRYLDQQATDWLTVDMDPQTLVSLHPISWPMISGDIEYWYEASQTGKFYQYADYSGLGIGLPGYSEELTTVEGRSPSYDEETERGDWFTRVRDGKSTYGAIKLHVRRGDSSPVETVDMFVARDQVWRGCLLATNAIPNGVLFRFEVRNKQDETAADFQFNTNFWYLSDSATTLPVSGSVIAGTTNDWGRIPWDGATGHILFQLDESTRALTVVHADWQDFNGWNDAHRAYFSGSSTDDVTRRGTSKGQREDEWFCKWWPEDVATNKNWNESFSPGPTSGFTPYEPFESSTSPNGFDVGEGQWVYGAYADPGADPQNDPQLALQMAGQGRGWIQLVNPVGDKPRGVGTVKFNARIAQTVTPDDFAYSGTGWALSDYTFLTRAAFDRNSNSNFTGNASLSLAAFYWPRTGCYEARWEQLTGNIDDQTGKVLGPSPRGQRLVLYRWAYEGQEWVSTELYAATNSGSVYSWPSGIAPQAIPMAHSITNGLMPFYIGAYNDTTKNETLVIAAIHIKGKNNAAQNRVGNTAAATIRNLADEQGWLYLVYRDTSERRLTFGTYGTLSANCEGVFVRPQLHTGIVSWGTEADTKKLATQIYPRGSTAVTATFYNNVSAYECSYDIVRGLWVIPSGRMDRISATETGAYNGLSASVVTQTVDIYTAPLGTTSWTTAPLASYTLTGFGRPGVQWGATNGLWTAEDSSVRLRAGGTVKKNLRTDVVIDNVQITQWAGQDWLGFNATERAQYGRTNFVYTSGWITDGALQLSPRRTKDDYPCSLRVPLCDGQRNSDRKTYRGLGIGSISIQYRNAQTNACLLVQIATNGVGETTLGDYTLDPGTDSGRWTTITNWDFSAMTADQRAGGTLECSPGLHGVVGTLRVIVDPTLRERVKDVTDPTAFGSVDIIEALYRDEPALDKGCWWGFNIRTIGDAYDVEQRMYLADNPMRSPNAPPYLGEIGRSLALNNSITEDCDPSEVGKSPNPFRAHMPFLQTPTFTSNIVGEVSFRARKWTLQKGAQNAEVALYGTTALDLDDLSDRDWGKPLQIFVISNTTYETYRYKTDANKSYRAFRFAVTGVDGVAWPGPDPTQGDEPVRVLLDDVLVSEAVRARLAFRNVGAFRHDITKTTYVPNVPSASEQPICGEGWGIQAEVYPAMLGDEIDQTVKPQVKLYYYKGGLSTAKWGFDQWKSEVKGAWLTRATDTNNFYRSSTSDSPDAVIPMANSVETVQWMLEVVYTVVNPETGGRSVATNRLESSDWTVPSWYYPKDYNVEFGGGADDRFSAFTIVEPIAPGWAWINEINIFGEFDAYFQNSDRKKQFVEVVKPTDYDLNGWTLRMLSAKNYGSTRTEFLTNDVAIFGVNGVPAQKAGGEHCDWMSFIVVGNPTTELKVKGTEWDGPWDREWTTDNKVFNGNYELGSYYPVAMQLVRPSGIIEHEVAILGTNAFESVAAAIAWQYTSTNLVNMLKANAPKSNALALPDDLGPTSVSNSVGVVEASGKTALCWNNTMSRTPGDLNEGQVIDPNVPHPGGELILVFANVDTSFGHIRQTVGKGTNTTESQTVTLERDSAGGLNIKYTVDPWFELGTLKETEDGKSRTPVIVATNKTTHSYVVNVGKGATGNVTITASAAIDANLRKYGLDENNRYTPAILNWLLKGQTLDGPFHETDAGEIKLATFLSLSGNVVTNMTLTQMYWLDMDPTAGEMYFRAGMVRPPSQVVLEKPTYDPENDPQAVTNLRMGVYMSISNGNGFAQHDSKSVWAPYVLRGLGLDELSWNYYPSGQSSGAWTSETFKVTGFLNSGLTRMSDAEAWIPLRYFIFKEGSFDANFEAEIDVADPFSTASPAYSEGWKRYVDEHGGEKPSVFMSWNIDERLRPITAEILAPTNRLDGTGK